MSYLTIHHLAGDPGELLARKQEVFDPVVEPLARKHGACLSLTAVAEDGLVIVNLWDSPAGAAAFAMSPKRSRPSRMRSCLYPIGSSDTKTSASLTFADMPL